MNKLKYIDDMGYAQARLLNTVIQYKKVPHLVQDILGGYELSLINLVSKADYAVEQDDDDLLLVPPRLGYVNGPAGSAYAYRNPMRRWKQGLDLRSLSFNGDIRIQDYHDEGLISMLTNSYPALEAAFGMIGCANPFSPQKRSSVAFSRTFAISGTGRNRGLHYKGLPVGQISTEGGFYLAEGYDHLEQALQESMG